MKKTDIMLRVASAFVFVAMVIYMAVYVYNRAVDPVQTALVVTASMTDSSTVSGLVVRDELVLKSDAPYINVIVTDGEKVGSGQTVAVVYGSEDALDRASRLTALESEIADVQAALSSGLGSVNSVQNRDGSVFDAITDLSASLRSDNFAGIDTKQSSLASLIFRTEVTSATEEYLQELYQDYRELSATTADETDEISVGQSGTFSVVVDGYEGVTPEYARGLAPSDLRELIAAERTNDDSALGKLVTSYKWYYAAIVGREDASKLVAGRTVRLSFGRYYSDFLTATVEYVGQAEGDEQLILFSMQKGFSDMLAVRAVSAELVYSEYTGLRIPLRGLYRYYAGYIAGGESGRLTEGGKVKLTLGDRSIIATVSEIGSISRIGELPYGVESGSELDTRPTRRLVVFYWPYDADEEAPDFSEGGGTVTAPDGTVLALSNYYDYDETKDRMCVFSMTGLQAERKKVTLVYAGEEYAIVTSEGSDALREGNDLIVQATDLYNGRVFR